MKNPLKIFYFFLIALLFTNCSFNNKENNNNVNEDVSQAKQEGYNRGYEVGYSDGYSWYQYGAFYNNYINKNTYISEDGQTLYRDGYKKGYEDGYWEGHNLKKSEREQKNKEIEEENKVEEPFFVYHNDNGEIWISHSREEEEIYQQRKAQKELYRQQLEEAFRRQQIERQNDFHNWERTSVENIYAKFYAEDDDDAEEQYYFYKKIKGDYYHEIKLDPGTYEIEIEEKIDYKFYKVKDSNIYLKFRDYPSLYRYDEGILDWDYYKFEFYKKPKE